MASPQFRRAWTAIGLTIGLTLTFSGCATINTPAKLLTWLQSGDPEDDNTAAYQDKWSNVGKEGRGSRSMEDDHDPFNKWLRSPKATAIENNLGIK